MELHTDGYIVIGFTTENQYPLANLPPSSKKDFRLSPPSLQKKLDSSTSGVSEADYIKRDDYQIKCVSSTTVLSHTCLLHSPSLHSQHRDQTDEKTLHVGILVDSEIVLSTRYGKTRVFINKNLINRDHLSPRPYQQRPLIKFVSW
jgi:hypothetical protein